MKVSESAWRLSDLSVEFPAANRGRLVVWGLLASNPYGGMTWQVLHHLVALRRLGFDVWYAEDNDAWVLDPEDFSQTADYRPNLAFLEQFMKLIGMEDRWIFRVPETTDIVHGGGPIGLQTLYQEADAVFNLCGSHGVLPHHDPIRCLVYLETDPVSNQVGVANEHEGTINQLSAHHHLFTYGENIGSLDFSIPVERFQWHPTRPPVWIDWWATDEPPSTSALTTVATLRHEVESKDAVWRSQALNWSKHHELERFIDLPSGSDLPLEMALGWVTNEDRSRLESHGWRVKSASPNPMEYRDYIRSSLGEFTVAKQQYVASRCGWFSDRSVCYLAAGRPVITQDTGFGNNIPCGEGLFAFSTHDEALTAIGEVNAEYAKHSTAAREIAREYFAAEVVLTKVLEQIGLL